MLQALSEEAMDFLNDFDIDGDGTFSYDEFVLFLVLLSMPLKDMQVRHPSLFSSEVLNDPIRS